MKEVHIFIDLFDKQFSNYDGIFEILKNKNKKILIFSPKSREYIVNIEHSNKKFFRFFFYKTLIKEITNFKIQNNLNTNDLKKYLYIDEDSYFSILFFYFFKNCTKIIIQHGLLTYKISNFNFIIRKIINYLSFKLFHLPIIGYGFGRSSEDFYLTFTNFEKKFLDSNNILPCGELIKKSIINYAEQININNKKIDFYIVMPSLFISSPFNNTIFKIINNICFLLNNLYKDCKIVIRPHYTNKILVEKFFTNSKLFTNIKYDYSSNHNLFFYSKTVITFNSSMIYESYIMQKKTINILPKIFNLVRGENVSDSIEIDGLNISENEKVDFFNKLNNPNKTLKPKIQTDQIFDKIIN